MNKLLSCEFNIDTGNVECRFADGTMISIDCDVVEDTIDGTLPFVRVRTELDWLIYNAPREYVQLVLNGGLNPGVFERVRDILLATSYTKKTS